MNSYNDAISHYREKLKEFRRVPLTLGLLPKAIRFGEPSPDSRMFPATRNNGMSDVLKSTTSRLRAWSNGFEPPTSRRS